MKSIVESISNRELAFLIWMLFLSLLVVFNASVRKVAGNLFRTIFWSKLTIYFLSVAAYTAGMAYLLWRMDLWNLSQVKNTILWFLTAGAASLFHITDREKSNYLKETIKDILSITVVLQFLLGIFSFNLFVELVYVPLAFLIGGMRIIAERNSEHSHLARLLRKLIVFIGVFLICYTLFKVITDFKSFATKGTLNDFLIPAVLSLMFLPMLYILSIIVTHDDVFTGIERRIKHPRLRRYARWKALIHFHANKTDLNRWRRLLFLETIRSKHDVAKSIERIKEMKRKEKFLAHVEFEKGWSPYAAMKFLTDNGIVTGYYQPAIDENDWMACSKYVEIDDNMPPSNISYYVEGGANVATKLTLNLTVYNRKQNGLAIAQFLQKVTILCKHALHQSIPQRIEDSIITGKNLEMNFGNRKIEIEKRLWENVKGGYHLNFKIEVIN